MEPIKVEIGQYKEINKGPLKASFSLLIQPMGLRINKCKYFVMNDKRWFNLPQEEVKYTDGRKTQYFPYMSFMNQEYDKALRESVLRALNDAKPETKNDQETAKTTASSSRSVQDNSLPF